MIHTAALNLLPVFLSANDDLIAHCPQIVEIALGKYIAPAAVIEPKAKHLLQNIQPDVDGNVCSQNHLCQMLQIVLLQILFQPV